MTGTPLALDRSALRDALSDMPIQSPDGVRLEEALALEQGWTPDFAERVADEYRGFLYLAATAGFEVTPSRTIDEAWHLHLTWPHYREILCARIIGRPLDHRPSTGEPEDDARCKRQYEDTLALYERVFGKPPPPDIWPDPAAFEEEDEEDDGLLGWPGSLKPAVTAAATLLMALAAVYAPPVVGLLLACLFAGLLLSLLLPYVVGKRRRNAACGSGCGLGGDSDGAGSCGGSCGGGCGGD